MNLDPDEDFRKKFPFKYISYKCHRGGKIVQKIFTGSRPQLHYYPNLCKSTFSVAFRPKLKCYVLTSYVLLHSTQSILSSTVSKFCPIISQIYPDTNIQDPALGYDLKFKKHSSFMQVLGLPGDLWCMVEFAENGIIDVFCPFDIIKPIENSPIYDNHILVSLVMQCFNLMSFAEF